MIVSALIGAVKFTGWYPDRVKAGAVDKIRPSPAVVTRSSQVRLVGETKDGGGLSAA